jgi:hypothetical protein
MTTVNLPRDCFELRLFLREDILGGWDVLRPFLEALLRDGGDLAPTLFRKSADQGIPLTLEVLSREFKRRRLPQDLWLSNERGVEIQVRGFAPDKDPGTKLIMHVPPATLDGERVLSLVGVLCRSIAPLYGFGHSLADASLGRDPHMTNTWAPKQVYEAYWLTILGAAMVRKLGRDRVQSTPAWRVEFLPNGASLIVLAPDPADLLSPAAREAQARALAHLRQDVAADQALRELLERNQRLALSAWAESATTSAEAVVTEWRPAKEALPSDVDDVAAAVAHHHSEAENFISGFHEQIEDLIAGDVDSLPRIDQHFLASDYWREHDAAMLERLFVPRLGAYLGTIVERRAGGRWMPRRLLEESQLIAGDRAWLPFLRVKRFVQSRQAAAEFCLARFFDEVERHTGGRRDQ